MKESERVRKSEKMRISGRKIGDVPRERQRGKENKRGCERERERKSLIEKF